jgi:hypothetical protein
MVFLDRDYLMVSLMNNLFRFNDLFFKPRDARFLSCEPMKAEVDPGPGSEGAGFTPLGPSHKGMKEFDEY